VVRMQEMIAQKITWQFLKRRVSYRN
jgi:hypothetical protein